MMYRMHMTDGVVEFVKNCGRAFLESSDPAGAVRATRDLFSHMRNEQVKSLGMGQYLVTFGVSLDYKLPLLRSVEKAVKLLRSRDLYEEGRFIDRYIVATVYMESGKPEYLKDIDIRKEISGLRKSAVISREVANFMDFVDYDICIYNYLELNSREGYRSRVVRVTADQ